ncbi:hypothetical protein BDR04DRAFT_1121327 [Suillus decipiens]|nr:hypothetical protein BDR04DRAFT_1121327 [Suillus decipiens]
MSNATISVLGSIGLIEISGDKYPLTSKYTSEDHFLYQGLSHHETATKPPGYYNQWNQSTSDKIKNEDNEAEGLVTVSTVGDDMKIEVDEQTKIKVEVEESKEPTSMDSPVYPCHLLTRLYGNQNQDLLDPFRPWHYSI